MGRGMYDHPGLRKLGHSLLHTLCPVGRTHAVLGDGGSFVKAGYPAAVSNAGSRPYGDPSYRTEGDVPELTDVENGAMTVQAAVPAIVTLDQEG